MKQLINDGWQFAKLPTGSTYEQACEARWVNVDIPHDWLIWQCDDLYETADAWYRRTLSGEETDASVCMIHFDGVYMDCDVLLDGSVLCTHHYGYTAFFTDLTKALTPGKEKYELMVHIRHQSPNSRWYSGSGIFRDVHLLRLPERYIVPDSLSVRESLNGEKWTVSLTAELKGPKGKTTEPWYLRLNDAEGHHITEAYWTENGDELSAELTIPGGVSWNPDNPYLYDLEFGNKLQQEKTRIGLRTVQTDPDRGFLLNGQSLKLKGVCLHHDLGALGAAFHMKAARRQLLLMKEMGVNAVRTSHNPPASGFLDLCDELGILVDDEAFDMWERSKTTYDYARFFKEDAKQDVALWIRRDRCHPSVVLWSIGNEIYDMHADRHGAEITEMLMNEVLKHDPDRHALVTFGCNYMPWKGGQRCADIVKVVGYNYGEQCYEEHHRHHPDWTIYGSETASILSSRCVYHFPMEEQIMSEADLQCSALGNSNTSWGASDLKTILVNDLKTPYSMGQFLWSGIDYIGEPTPYHTRSCYFGQADTACFPKDAFYLIKSYWNDEPMVHIGVSWDWNPGQMIDVPVMTNLPEAELFLNGVSLGRKDNEIWSADACIPVWHVPYEAGVLMVKAYDREKGKICTDSVQTPGEVDSFRLHPDDEALKSDGYDMTFVTIQAVDSKGTPVSNARNRVHVAVEGGGYLLGCDNGDSTDREGYKSSSRRLFGGKLLLMIGSNGRAEDTAVRIRYGEGKTETILIRSETAPVLDGRSCVTRIQESPVLEEGQVRKLEIIPVGDGIRELSPEHPICQFRWKTYPEGETPVRLDWEITNRGGIESPNARISVSDDIITVQAHGDGDFMLRALFGNEQEYPEMISQMEFSAHGFGQPALNPYEFISAGLYDIREGNIGAGNDKGIAFDRNGPSMIGFSEIDFGKTGSDRLELSVFALNGDPYEIEVFDGLPQDVKKPMTVLIYQKPSIWNVYQPETFTLPVRLAGRHCLCFRMKNKVHLKGFVFERQSSAEIWHPASEADEIYGDQYDVSGEKVCSIGNNVTLTWRGIDFSDCRKAKLILEGFTPLEKNTVSIRMENEKKEQVIEIAEFCGAESGRQEFAVSVPGGLSSVSFVFLPGSCFDFYGYSFRLSPEQA